MNEAPSTASGDHNSSESAASPFPNAAEDGAGEPDADSAAEGQAAAEAESGDDAADDEEVKAAVDAKYIGTKLRV